MTGSAGSGGGSGSGSGVGSGSGFDLGFDLDFGFGLSVDRADLGELGKKMGNPGQCLAVYPLQNDPNTLFKEYRPTQLTPQDEVRLGQLVAWPRGLRSRLDREFLLRHTAWPLSRVTSDGRTVGVLMKLAPDRFFERITDPYGSQRVALMLDHLAVPDEKLPGMGLKSQDTAQRLKVCAEILAVAEFFERHELVYGDWGYQNIFWSQQDSSVYFIDVDGCSIGPQSWVESFGFEDALTPQSAQVDRYTERFRCAIMVAACLTGHKDPAAALPALDALTRTEPRLAVLAGVVRDNVDAAHRGRRKPIADLRAAIRTDADDESAAGGIPRPRPWLGPGLGPSGQGQGQGQGQAEQPASHDNIEGWVAIDTLVGSAKAGLAKTADIKAARAEAAQAGADQARAVRSSVDHARAVRIRVAITLTVLTLLIVLIVVLSTS